VGVSTIGHRCLEVVIVASVCAVAWHRSTRRAQAALVVALAGTVAAVALLGRALVQLDLRLAYVADFARRDSNSLYRLVALWGGMAGSLLVWLTVLTLLGLVATVHTRRAMPSHAPVGIAVWSSVIAAFAIISRFVADPFERLGLPPIDGNGLTPILHHAAMLYHPPLVYFGLTATLIPFSLTLASRAIHDRTRRADPLVRRWLLVSWVLLTVGMLAGAHWSYAEVGWGGYWAWDPVENGVLLPWLAATFFLHSRQRARHYDDLAVVGCFVAAIIGAYVTRSGVSQSVHSFAEARDVGVALAIVLGLLVTGSVALLVRDRRPAPRVAVPRTRRAIALATQNAALAALMGAVLIGTVYPLLRRAFGTRVSVGGAYYTRVGTPLVWALLIGLAAGPARRLTRTTSVVLVAVAATVVALASRSAPLPVAFTLGLGAAALAASILALTQHPRQRAGGFVAHAGFALLLVGVAGSAMGTSRTIALQPGERAHVEGYDVALQAVRAETHATFARLRADFVVTRDATEVARLAPSIDIYERRGIALPETSYRSSPIDDVMIAVRDVDDDETVVAQVTVRPLMWWLWWGGLTMLAGGLFALVAGRRAPSTSLTLSREQPRERVLL
jgi:cytochrome c-type biogenesis protein CcmF